MSTAALEHLLKEKLMREEPLAKYTAARIGGPAEMLYVANGTTDELRDVVVSAWGGGVPVRVLGGGANVLVPDEGIRGLVVINRVKDVTFEGERVRVSAGYGLTTLAQRCASEGLAGFEWAVSVPGTVGGGVVNNAGAHGGDMSDSLVWARVLFADGGEVTMDRDALAYGYRESALKGRADRRFLVLETELQLEQDATDAIRERMADFRTHRKATQPPGASLGSIFKNPPGDYAGRLIEEAGLKGLVIGGAGVSEVHANFFVNTGGATASDYMTLVQQVRERVAAATGVMLEPEIELLGGGL